MTYKIILKEQSFSIEDVDRFKEKVKELINDGVVILETRIENQQTKPNEDVMQGNLQPRDDVGKGDKTADALTGKRHYKKRKKAQKAIESNGKPQNELREK
jgi:hypothetical protein